jgi:(R,R)-butanediol dehydrogenase/meso-butanediol dehydrogenase/diacetyl reductase
MRAAVTTGAGTPLALEDRPDPAPGPGELLVRVRSCGICGSDLHIAEQLDLPGIVLGHELAGEVVALGEGTDGFVEGDAVCAFPLVGCGTCPACLAGAPAHCAVGGELIGLQRSGGFAEHVVTSARLSYRLPLSLSARDGALVEPLAVALHAVDGALRTPDEPMLVLGGGPVGQAVVLWLRHLGVRDVVLSDPVAHRRALAERLGASASVDPGAEDVRGAVERATGSPPGAVIECVGVPGLIQHALDVAGPESRVTIVGVCMFPDEVVPFTALQKELTMRFVLYYREADFARTLAALDADALDAAALVTDRIGLDELPARFEALKHPTTECKVLIQP